MKCGLQAKWKSKDIVVSWSHSCTDLGLASFVLGAAPPQPQRLMTISCTVSTYLNKPVLNNASVAFVEPKASEEGSFQPIRQKFLRRCDQEFHHKHMSLMLIDHAHAHSTSRPHLHLLFWVAAKLWGYVSPSGVFMRNALTVFRFKLSALIAFERRNVQGLLLSNNFRHVPIECIPCLRCRLCAKIHGQKYRSLNEACTCIGQLPWNLSSYLLCFHFPLISCQVSPPPSPFLRVVYHQRNWWIQGFRDITPFNFVLIHKIYLVYIASWSNWIDFMFCNSLL